MHVCMYVCYILCAYGMVEGRVHPRTLAPLGELPSACTKLTHACLYRLSLRLRRATVNCPCPPLNGKEHDHLWSLND